MLHLHPSKEDEMTHLSESIIRQMSRKSKNMGISRKSASCIGSLSTDGNMFGEEVASRSRLFRQSYDKYIRDKSAMLQTSDNLRLRPAMLDNHSVRFDKMLSREQV